MWRVPKLLKCNRWEALARRGYHCGGRIDANQVDIPVAMQESQRTTIPAAEIEDAATRSEQILEALHVHWMGERFARPNPIPVIGLEIQILHHGLFMLGHYRRTRWQ